MHHRLAYCLTLIGIISNLCIVYADVNLHTTYSNGTFHTTKYVIAEADFNTCSLVIDSFIHDFQTNPANLFEWAFKDLGQTHKDDGSDDVVLIYNSISYNPDSAKSIINADFVMSNGMTFRNRNLMSYVYDKQPHENYRTISVDIYYSGALLKKADGLFEIEQINDNQTKISIAINIRFGWFFNLFISQRRYRNVIGWRIGKFLENLKDSADAQNM